MNIGTKYRKEKDNHIYKDTVSPDQVPHDSNSPNDSDTGIIARVHQVLMWYCVLSINSRWHAAETTELHMIWKDVLVLSPRLSNTLMRIKNCLCNGTPISRPLYLYCWLPGHLHKSNRKCQHYNACGT